MSSKKLWQALQPLRSTACWLMVGAHPDDEWSGFLAWLAFGRGVHTVYACATRGEGGQNALGPERGPPLAALRSREMERAATELDLAVRWLGAGPTHGLDDPVFDFGFSRSAEDTLGRWGEARLLERLVRLIRTERPDALSPTFLDVPGQHGHHRAITRSALTAAALAADPGFKLPDPDLPAWKVRKIYLPAFSGAGAAYDDREPPPPETVRVDLSGFCAPLEMSWAQIGERSRAYHASQGMGRPVPPGKLPFPLHLQLGAPDRDEPLSGVGDLVDIIPDGDAVQAALAETVGAWPDAPRVAACAHRALGALDAVRLPDGADDIARRLRLKRHQLGRVAALALGIGADVSVAPLRAGRPARLRVAVRGGADATLRLPAGWRVEQHLEIPATASPFDTLRDGFDPLGGNDPLGVRLTWRHAGSEGTMEIDPPDRIALAPAREPRPVVPKLPQVAIDPDARVGVVAGTADETLGWLRRLGIAAAAVDDATLAEGDLSQFTTLLIGCLGFGQRPVALAHRDRLVAWTHAGGSLVTMYHRPGDGWQDGRTPPLRLVVGSPSFRWRVTVPNAPVTVLAPHHPLLSTPNRITTADWDGWVRERGLYFASDWDASYTPLLEMSDPGEPPLRGALLAAPLGAGRHAHVALALHHQFTALVSGAFRLLANLVARP